MNTADVIELLEGPPRDAAMSEAAHERVDAAIAHVMELDTHVERFRSQRDEALGERDSLRDLVERLRTEMSHAYRDNGHLQNLVWSLWVANSGGIPGHVRHELEYRDAHPREEELFREIRTMQRPHPDIDHITYWGPEDQRPARDPR